MDSRSMIKFELCRLLRCTLVLGASLMALRFAGAASEPVDDRPAARLQYNRDIRPILANNCFRCHGLDEKARKAGLRLDDSVAATRPSELGGTAIVPGKPGDSELIRRIYSDDPGFVMPPPQANKVLSAAEKDRLRIWIEQGAEYQSHWSFIAPVRPAPPSVSNTAWIRNPIDRFVLARLDAERMQPSPEADRSALIRRVTLDLTGLPPTAQEVRAFVADNRSDAYERLVDRLLHSPRYGERMAIDWLDAARFADTHGYHIDSGRDMSRWREWVIDAFNHNMPFDRFTIEQLAGDLLPNATLEQKVASGFNRNHMINYEGGAIPEEYHTAYIVDRVNTTGTVWLGLTVGCAQCHDHKYDPISQKEYYGLYSFFHNVPENGLDGRAGNAAPVLKLPTSEQARQLAEIAQSLQTLQQRLAGPMPELDAAQAAWEKSASDSSANRWRILDAKQLQARGDTTLKKLEDLSVLAAGPNPAKETYTVVASLQLDSVTGIRLEAIPDDSFTARGPGRSVNGNIVLTDVRVQAKRSEGSGEFIPVKLKAAAADFSQKDFPVSNAIDADPNTGWAIHPEVGKSHSAIFEFESPVSATAPDDQPKQPIALSITLDFQSQFAQHQLGRFRLAATDAKNPQGAVQLPANIAEILSVPSGDRNDAKKSELERYYRTNVSSAIKEMNAEVARLKQAQAEVEKGISTTMVMQEMEKPRETFLLVRGQYDKKGEKVTSTVPASLGRLREQAPANRLGLAEWLVDSSQPLTARVAVNRYWQMYFGTGIVKTAEDLGTQGEWPSHPELLDWLATEFRDSGWDIRHLQQLIVTSATYRQSSVVSGNSVARDPENRLLSRGPRFRLQVEFIRDQALALAGMLNGEIGGSSVSPYQPSGIWEELAYRQDGKNFTAQEYVQSHGRDLYRRTMYTFIKRTAPPPSLVTMDAPDRETCTVRRSRTNTPLQALILMNDPTYVEAARGFAVRLMRESEPTASCEERIAQAFLMATSRTPTLEELRVLRRAFDAQRAAYGRDPDAAKKLVTVGESPVDDGLDAAELAAWTVVANILLNLDETITKG
jgi:hypothetical protein